MAPDHDVERHGRTRDLTGITAPKVGLLALGSTAAGAADNITAEFDYFTITPDDTAVECSPPCVVETSTEPR